MHARPRAAVSTAVISLALATLLACGGEREVAAPLPEAPIELTGSYRVSGVTAELESGTRRDIGGMLILAQQGDEYTAKFHLNTMYPTPDGILPADVVGSGEGTIDGTRLSGQSETQLIFGIVPGEAGNFPMAPRIYGPRVVSKSSGTIDAEGNLEFTSENEAAAGEAYPATRTTLKGSRIATDWKRARAERDE